MKKQQQGFPIIPGLGLPGQREKSQRDIKTDLILVRKQTGDSIVLWTGIFLCLFSIVLIIGPLVGYVAGILAFLVVLLYSYAMIHKQAQPIPVLVAIVGLSFLGFWIIAGYQITDRFWWTTRCEWEPRNKLVLVIFLLGVATILFFNMYRFAYEVVDPNSQPTVHPRPPEWGIMWPFKQPPRDEPEYESHNIPEPEVRYVPRPYAANTKNTATDNLDASRVNENKTVISPSGREVSVNDLVEFVKFAPISGATFRPWKKRKWTHNQWKDVVEVWKIYGVVSANGERSTTEIVVTDLREALTRLSSAFAPPTPDV